MCMRRLSVILTWEDPFRTRTNTHLFALGVPNSGVGGGTKSVLLNVITHSESAGMFPVMMLEVKCV